MATSVIMPALEMAQETGVLVSWLKRDGETVSKGEPLMEIETDKVTVEIEAPASGILGGILVKEGDAVPVGQTIAWILAPGEAAPKTETQVSPSGRASNNPKPEQTVQPAGMRELTEASPVARKMAKEHGIDLAALKSDGSRIEKADVLAYLGSTADAPIARLTPASPKARRLAAERGIELSSLTGSGPEGAVLTADVPLEQAHEPQAGQAETPSTLWRVMAEHMSASWSSVPHFYLVREVDAGRLTEWREGITKAVEASTGGKPSFTDLLVKLTAAALRNHPRLNAAWVDGKIEFHQQIHVGLAVAVQDGLVVPVIRNADAASISEIVTQRKDLVERAQKRKLRPGDIADATFTLSNLGMYNVDAFQAIVNAPQAAILAVGRIADRVVPVKGQIAIRPTVILTLSCDHRAVDGARAAQFLDELGSLIEQPLGLLS